MHAMAVFTRARFLALAVLLLVSLDSYGQLGIKLETARNKYLRYEPIRARIVLRNYSGNTLVFGSGRSRRGYLDFVIESQDGREARKLDKTTNVADNLILGAGETKELTLTLNNLYDLQREGVYSVSAQIGHERLRNDFRSNELTLEVRDGLELWSRTIGLPTGSTTSGIDSRKATLLLFHENPGYVYCLKVEDDDMVYGVVRLGPKITGSAPQCDVDAVSNVHILVQIKSRLFAYRVYDYNVKLKQEKYFMPLPDMPYLHRDPDIGRIMVQGGRPAVPGVDFQRTAEKEDFAPPHAAVPPSYGTGGAMSPDAGQAGMPPQAAVPAKSSEKKKPGLFGRVRGWFSRDD